MVHLPGEAEDDLQLNAAVPVEENGTSWVAQTTSLVKPEFTGTLTVSSEMYVITRAEIGHMVQTLDIIRIDPTAEDWVALETIKSSVKEFKT
jgi:hypothetical protein